MSATKLLMGPMQEEPIPIIPVTKKAFSSGALNSPTASAFTQNYLGTVGFEGEPHSFAIVPDDTGQAQAVYVGVKSLDDPWAFASLPKQLKSGRYFIDAALTDEQATKAITGWQLGTYEFKKYKHGPATSTPRLVNPPNADTRRAMREVTAMALIRDLIHRSANDLGPEQLEQEALRIAKRFNAAAAVIKGLPLERDYPLVSLVGQAGQEKGRLIDISWGDDAHPKVTLVGKGVTYDTGGLNIKPASGMRDMHTDMSGAAQVLGLARMIMDADLPIKLRVLIPAVENAVSENAMRTGDIVYSPLLKESVRIGHTDAEGRVILAEPLRAAANEKPDLLIDFATLTGAAKRALGNLPALFCNNEELQSGLLESGKEMEDLLWPMPMLEVKDDFEAALKDKRADRVSDPDNGNPDHIMAALWLNHCVNNDNVPWAHIDFHPTGEDKPGRPGTGSEKAVRAVYNFLEKKYDPKP